MLTSSNILTSVLLLETLGPSLADDFYSHHVKSVWGHDVSLEEYRGKVTLVVNVASECGYTYDHYTALVKLRNEYVRERKEPFEVLAFPCNQFGAQERADGRAIKEWAYTQFHADFPIFEKIGVVGRYADPVYLFLRQNSGRVPEWNFWKYLVSADGEVVNQWGPRTSWKEIRRNINNQLEKTKPKTEL